MMILPNYQVLSLFSSVNHKRPCLKCLPNFDIIVQTLLALSPVVGIEIGVDRAAEEATIPRGSDYLPNGVTDTVVMATLTNENHL